MVKRRGVSYSPGSKKKRLESPSLTPVNQEKCMLNDGLLNLYKKDLPKNEIALNSKGDSSSGKQAASENTESLKTPAREKKKRNLAPVASFSTINFEDVGGMPETLRKIRRMFRHHQQPAYIQKKSPVRGILLHGPPGCGKTHLAKAIAGELQLPILEVGATELVNGISGESEGKIREAFDTAIATGRCILFIDNIHSICLKSSENGMAQRMGQQLMKCFDDLATKDVEGRVMVVGATNQPDAMDPGLRGGDRFSREVAIGMPDKDARQRILEILCKGMKLSPEFSLPWLAKSTPGYVGGDLKNLVNNAEEFGHERLDDLIESSSKEGDGQSESGKVVSKPSDLEILQKDREWWIRLKDLPEEVADNFYFTEEDFKKALQEYVPFAKKEGFASVDSVTWDDVGGLADVKQELRQIIVWPIKYSEFYEANNLSTPKGILLFGPKGCGKTLVAKAIANECNLNFLSVNGPELLSMYVGESERAIRNTFERAQNSAPCVIFFDEFDALCPPRSSTKENAPVERVVNQLLCASDGTRSRKQVILVAATNRLDKIDSAMLRPGRLEMVYYVGLPSPEGRVDILKSLTKNKTEPKIADDLALETIARDPRCEEFSGADLAHLVRKATSIAVVEIVGKLNGEEDNPCRTPFKLTHSHFLQALDVVKPSLSEQDRKYFQKHSSFCHAKSNSALDVLELRKNITKQEDNDK